MVKRKTQPLIDSESSSDSESGSDLDSELLSLAKKKKTTRLASNSPGGAGGADSGSDSDSGSGSDSDGEPAEAKAAPAAPAQRKKRGAKAASSSEESEESESEEEEEEEEESEGEQKKPAAVTAAAAAPATGVKRKQDDEEGDKSEPEEGQVSSEGESGSGSEDDESGSESSSDDSEFDDGYDENLMGDEEDRARLNGLSEKERETEIFKRIERRDVMKTRWEIERKLKLAKKAERAKDKESQPPRKKKKKTKKVKQQQQAKAQQQKEQKEQLEKKKAKAPSPEPEEESPAPSGAAQRQDEHEDASEGEVDNESVLSSSPEKSGKDAESGGTSDYFDPKERSKERKKNVEANRTDDKRSNAMAMLKAKREGKAKREEEEAKREAQRKAEAEDRDELEDVPGGSKSSQKLKASDIYSDDSGSDSDEGEKKTGTARSRSGSASGSGSGSDSRSSSDSETEGSDAKEKKSSSGSGSSKKVVAISTRDELNKLRLSRHKIERFIALPMFDTIVLNCFVRINIGNNNGRPVYRVAEIVGVVETAKIYQFGRGRTNKGFKLKHGSQERVFRLEFISNQDFTDSEYQKWLSVCEATGTPMPCVDIIDRKASEIKEAIQYEFKDADIDKIIEEKNRFRAHPTNYAMKKTLLMKERDAAQLRGEDDLARDLNTQIQELEERASHLDKRRSSSISLISYINDRNRKRNVEDAEKAIMEEIRATRGIKIEDPFTRRQTQPRMSFKANEKRDEPEAMQMPAPPPPGQKKKPDEKRASSSADNNLYSLHDFEIDLDVPLPISAVNVLPKPVEKPVKESGPKRSLNLEDYKKKRGLI
ncbi:RNA polymerase-associated protein Rtf1 [Culex pipiens pallens]|uniref:RNA polymerase-associated protein Rtf1 n=1 Tax=Culex pipiens pallens TaxID=42434 RepID=UPI00195380A9|nr:RNA polymerase-associated protein Rtf1 [Culex pipiens pallens]